MKKILMILTSYDRLENTDSKTGVWLGEFTDSYYEFIDKDYSVTVASPKGGKPPIDPMSELTENISPSNRRFKEDDEAQRTFANTKKLDEINGDEFDAIFYPGGHGPIWDLANNSVSGGLILSFLSNEKPVGAVCHGPAALIKAAEIQPSILKGKRVTGFTNSEETLAMRKNNIPYTLENRLKELGADFKSAAVPYAPYVVEDGLLVTGQNPLSSGPAAKKLIEKLEG